MLARRLASGFVVSPNRTPIATVGTAVAMIVSSTEPDPRSAPPQPPITKPIAPPVSTPVSGGRRRNRLRPAPTAAKIAV